MHNLRLASLLVFVLILPGQAIAQGNTGVEFEQVTPLSDAVEQFNARVKSMSEIGRAQPLLTVDEVVASIRRWDRNRTPIEPGLKAVFDRIAEAEEMPPDSALMFGTGLISNRQYHFTVWWIDLHLYYPRPDRDPEESRFVYIHRIRDRTISSRRLTQDDLARIDSDSSALSLPEREQLAAKHFADFASGKDSNQNADNNAIHRSGEAASNRVENLSSPPGDR